MKSKKGQGISINVIIVAAIALIVLVVIVFIFSNRIGDFGDSLESCTGKGGECQSGISCSTGYAKAGTCDTSKGNSPSVACCIKVLGN